MSDPTPDTLTAAAQRAQSIADQIDYEAAILIGNGDMMLRLELAATDLRRIARTIAHLAAPASTVDREALIRLGHDAVDWHTLVTPERVRSTTIVAHVVDALLSAGYVTTRPDEALIEHACNIAVAKTTHRGEWVTDERAVARTAIEFYLRNATAVQMTPVSAVRLAEHIRSLEEMPPGHAYALAEHLLSDYDVRAKTAPPAEGGGQS